MFTAATLSLRRSSILCAALTLTALSPLQAKQPVPFKSSVVAAIVASTRGVTSNFAQRSAMDIEGLGVMWIDAFVEKGFLKDLADIYYLDYDKVKNLERMGEKLLIEPGCRNEA